MALTLAFGVLLAVAATQAQRAIVPGPAAARGAPCPPLAIPYGVYEPPIAGYNSIADGGRVKVSCLPAYENHGASWVVCQQGRWVTAAWEGTSSSPQCLASCEPPKVENAEFTPAVAGKGLTRHGTRVTIGCAEGFEYVGDSILTCYHGQWTGLGEGKCLAGNESFCRNPEMVSIINGILNTYMSEDKKDPLRASEAINYYFLNLQGIKADGLTYLGINPASPQKPQDRLAYYIPGLTGSDAVFRSVVLPGSWNMTTAPQHLNGQYAYCRIINEDLDVTAYVLKVLYRANWGSFSFF